MALLQSETVKRRHSTPSPHTAGIVAVAKFSFKGVIKTSDVLEIGILPATAQLISASLISTSAETAIKAEVGIMTGEAGTDPTVARTVGTEILAATTIVSTTANATLAKCIAIAPKPVDRGIGVTVDVPTIAADELTLVIEYTY